MKRTAPYVFFAIAFAALLSGCASTAYQDGYTTRFQIGPDKWIAYYEGTADMSEALVMDYAIHHCASVALDLGYPYYKILDLQRGGTTQSRTIPGMTIMRPIATDGGGTMVIETRTPDRTLVSSRESFSVTIECFHEPTEGALNAREVWYAFRERAEQPAQ